MLSDLLNESLVNISGFLSSHRGFDVFSSRLLMSLLIAIGVLIAWRIWKFTISPLLNPAEPKPLPYWIPFVGHAISFFRDSDGTFTSAREHFGDTREPFSITVAGERMYIITAASDILECYRNIETLTFDQIVTDMMVAFGSTSDGIKRMWGPPSQKTSAGKRFGQRAKSLTHLAEGLAKQQLHPGKELDQLQQVLLTGVKDCMLWENMSPKAILSYEGPCRTVSVLRWTREILLAGATTSFFGDKLLEIEPNLFQNFFSFDDTAWKLTYKVPPPWSNDMIAYKRTAQDALTKYFQLPVESRTDACWLVLSLEDEMRAVGIGASDIAAYLMMIYWVTNANTWKVCFWMLAYLLHDPILLQTMRDEVSHVVKTSSDPVELARNLNSCSSFVAFYQEVLRLITSSISVRNVTTPTWIGGKLLKAGGRVIMPYRQLSFDPTVFGDHVYDFDPERFVKSKNLGNSPSFRPYGGGTTHCPGRFLAKAEILSCIALAISSYDLELDTNGGSATHFPLLDIKKPHLGIFGPVPGDDVIAIMRARKVE